MHSAIPQNRSHSSEQEPFLNNYIQGNQGLQSFRRFQGLGFRFGVLGFIVPLGFRV